MNARSRFPLRGGNWNNGANAGLTAFNLNNSRSNSNNNIGFRPALDNARCINFTELCQCKFEKDASTSVNHTETKQQAVDASIACAFSQICNYDNLLSAAMQCKRGKAKSSATLCFFDNLEENIINLLNELTWGTYELSPYRHFYVFEPKRRLISAPHFRDRVVHRAIYNVIEPLFDKQYIYDSFACRRGKGTHSGARRAQQFIKRVESTSGKAYALKADISKYFSSINHSILKRFLNSKLNCEKTKDLLFYIINNSPSDKEGVGIPLGNLTSQVFANIYLNELDRFVKHNLKAKYYIRYMDDFAIIHPCKTQLKFWLFEIEHFLNESLKLKTNNKTQIFPIAKTKGRALDFMGCRIYSTHKLLRKTSVKRIKHTVKTLQKQFKKGDVSTKQINNHLQSWLGHAKHANAHSLTEKILNTSFTRANHVHTKRH